MTTTGEPTAPRLSARQLARKRRVAAWKRDWAQFRTHRSGVVGLGILVVFVTVALAAPILASWRPRAGSTSPAPTGRCWARRRRTT